MGEVVDAEAGVGGWGGQIGLRSGVDVGVIRGVECGFIVL